MSEFRKKPVVIEAVKVSDVIEFIKDPSRPSVTQWVYEAFEDKVIAAPGRVLRIRTLEGEMTGEPEDWLIRGVKGELYPCKPDIFAATYDAIDE